MEYAWLAPEPGLLKVNVHWVTAEDHIPLGNQNGVGVIVRNSEGAKKWGAMGPLNGMNELQACLWAAQVGIIQAWQRGFHAIQVEVVNRELYDAIRFQEYVFPPPDLEEALL